MDLKRWDIAGFDGSCAGGCFGVAERGLERSIDPIEDHRVDQVLRAGKIELPITAILRE